MTCLSTFRSEILSSSILRHLSVSSTAGFAAYHGAVIRLHYSARIIACQSHATVCEHLCQTQHLPS